MKKQTRELATGMTYDNRNIVVVGTSRDSETARFFVVSFWHLLDRISSAGSMARSRAKIFAILFDFILFK